MNSFLLDIELEKEMGREDGSRVLFYERYANDIIEGIEKGRVAAPLFKKRF